MITTEMMIFMIKSGVGTFKASSCEKLAFEGSSYVITPCPHSEGLCVAYESSLLQLVLSQKSSIHYFSDLLGRGISIH